MLYRREIIADGIDSLSRIAAMIKAEDAVLDLGIGCGELGAYLVSEKQCVVDGIELDSEFIEEASKSYRDIFQANLDGDDWQQGIEGRRYDVIVCADVIEHLQNGQQVLKELKRFLSPQGCILLSIPNVAYAGVALELLGGRFEYRDEGILDRTHVKFYTRSSLLHLIDSAGLHLHELATIEQPLHATEFSSHSFDNIPASLVDIISEREDALVYQFLATVLAEPVGESVAMALEGTSSVQGRYELNLYWISSDDLSYNADKSSKIWLDLSTSVNSFTLICSAAKGVEKIRFSPSDRQGYLHLGALSLSDVNNHEVDLLSQWQTISSGADYQGLSFDKGPPEESGVLLLSHTRGPWIEFDLSGLDLDLSGELTLSGRISVPESQDFRRLSSLAKTHQDELLAFSNKAGEYRAHMRGLQGEVKKLTELLAIKVQEKQYLDTQLQAVYQSPLWVPAHVFAWIKKRIKPRTWTRYIFPWQVNNGSGLQLDKGETFEPDNQASYSIVNAFTGIALDLELKLQAGSKFLEIDFDSEQPLYGPRLAYFINGNWTMAEDYLHISFRKDKIFGVIQWPENCESLMIFPSRLNNSVRINRCKVAELPASMEWLHSYHWYKYYRAFGLRWLFERFKGFLLECKEDLAAGRFNRSYQQWWTSYAQVSNSQLLSQKAQSLTFNNRPLISIVLPVYNTPVKWLTKAIDSVLQQSYEHWELCIADDASTEAATLSCLRRYEQQDQRVKVVYRPDNGHISAASNTALENCTGDYVALLDHDDELAPNALYEMVREINASDAQLLYSDEDIIDIDNQHLRPHFKPRWNPDFLRSINYICHFLVIKRALIEQCGGFREGYEGAQDYDLVLRVTAELQSHQIVHVPKVLYHWRAIEGSTALDVGEKDYASDAGVRALQDLLDKVSPGATAVSTEIDTGYRVKYPLLSPEKVSVIIPTYNGLQVLRNCIRSILDNTNYPDYEILIIDNNSDDPALLSYLEELDQLEIISVLPYKKAFNYSAINNWAVTQSSGSTLAFVNNDVEFINSEWLSEMVSHAIRDEVGAVGSKLFFAENHIQHAGVVLGLGEDHIAGHACRGFHAHAVGPLCRLRLIQNYSAVTAACMVVTKEKFLSVDGFDEVDLSVAFNDVDLCLKLMKAGYRNVWTPYAQLFHFESMTRGYDNVGKNLVRLQGEAAVMRERWGTLLRNDPFYNPNLTDMKEDFSMAWPPRVVEP